MLNVLIVEDSDVSREYIVELLARDPDILVVGTAGDGLEAVHKVRQLKPDMILMDMHMPGMNGIQATRQIMSMMATPIIVMSATTAGEEAQMAVEATRAGAVTFINKPRGGVSDDAEGFIEIVKSMAEVKVIHRWVRPEKIRSVVVPERRPTAVRLIAIGASTGGPPALMEVLKGLPANVGIPILLAQHIMPGFAKDLAAWLNSGTELKIEVAQAGQYMEPGHGYLAPDRLQMTVGTSNRIRLAELPDEGSASSIDRMFESVAKTYGPAAIGVLLTGMGRDGAVGLKSLYEAGALTIAQDAASSAVFGMPKEAIRLNAAMHVLPLRDIAKVICESIYPKSER